MTDLSGTTVYADTKMGPSSVNYTWTGSPETFWFDHGCDFWSVEWEFYYYSPNSDWGDCDTMGATQWTLTLGTNVGISPWDDWGADITFNAVGTYQITASFPGWSCTGGQCGPTVQGCGASVTVNILPQPTNTPTPTSTPTPTPTPLPVVSCSNMSLTEYSSGVVYCVALQGWRSFNFTFNLKCKQCSDNTDRFNPISGYVSMTICPSGPERIFGYTHEVSLRDIGGGNTWFGPTDLPADHQAALMCTLGADYAGRPSMTYNNYRTNEVFFNSISAALDLGQYTYAVVFHLNMGDKIEPI